MPGNVGHMTPRWQTAGTYESAGESQRFSSISARARLIDELHLAFRPILMVSGENLFAGIDVAALGVSLQRKCVRRTRDARGPKKQA